MLLCFDLDFDLDFSQSPRSDNLCLGSMSALGLQLVQRERHLNL
jgi:hypothetical protein